MNDSTTSSGLRNTPSLNIKRNNNKVFLEWVHISKGIGIALVVIGHYYPVAYPAYWPEIRKLIYSFHMPLFFMISGYLYRFGYYDYPKLIKSKIKRLVFPFLSTALIFLLIKIFAGHFVNLQYPVNPASINNLLVDPVNSYMPLLWFVHALFIIFLIYPAGRIFLNSTGVFIVLIAVNLIFGSNFFVFGNALANAPFFAFGVLLREQHLFNKVILGGRWFQVCAPILVFFAFYIVKNSESVKVNNIVVFYVLGGFGALFVLNLSHFLSRFKDRLFARRLMALGEYSMGIYLLHPLFESSVRIGFDKILGKYEFSFETMALTAIVCGLFFPAYLEKHILRKHPASKKYLLGI